MVGRRRKGAGKGFLSALAKMHREDRDRRAAQGMAAPSGGETGTGSPEGNSPVGSADAPIPTEDHPHAHQ